MAIDFGRMFKNVATGYLSAKIANTEANDALKADIIKQASLNFYNNTLPEYQKKEKNRKETYGKVSSRYGGDVAEYMDQNGFIAGSSTDFANIVELLGANENFNETKLKAYLEATKAGTYESRSQGRLEDIQEREKFVTGNLEKNQIGSMTAQLFLGKDKTMTDATATTDMKPDTATETITTPSTQVGPVVTEAKTETREIPLPTYEDIFGSGEETLQTNFSKMSYENKTRIIDDARQEYQAVYGFDKLTGLPKVPENYKLKYKELVKSNPEEYKNITLEKYAYDRFFKEQYLPKVQVGYNEPYAVSKAREAINYNKSIGNEAAVEEARSILKSMGYDPNDYGL
tara:strand:+ start:1034 stop:2065 length:1032 start_codon:yes stop_codon:yes gene_type:complete